MELLDTDASLPAIYRQAKRILKSTTRAKNADWYKSATDLQVQWHLWIGTTTTASGIFNKSLNQWWKGPALPQVSLETDEGGNPVGLDETSRSAVHELLRQLLSSKEFGGKPKSLGIVLHVADGMRVRDLAPDFAEDDDFGTLNELLVTAPEIALGDDTVDPGEGDWRLLPLPGARETEKRSLAVQISSKFRPVVNELRAYGELRNIPVVAETRSAAIESVSGLPSVIAELGTTEDNTLCLLQYEAFTLISATGRKGELLMVRPLVHRSGPHLTPEETDDIITSTAALLNMKDPRLILVSMSGLPEEHLEKLLVPYLESHAEAPHHCLDILNSPLVEGIPGGRFEFALSTRQEDAKAAGNSHLFKLREKWAVQDFYGPSQEETRKMPTRGDLRLLKFSSLAQKAAIVGLLAFIGWTGMDFFTKMRSEPWKLSALAAPEMEARVALLQKERRQWEHWSGLLAKRSEGWLAMQALLDLFPDDGGVILRSAAYRASAKSSSSKKDVVGLDRNWTISGYANPEVATQLSTLGSRTRVGGLLNRIAEENHADYLSVGTETRELDVTLQQKQGSMPPTQEFPVKMARHFRTTFELSIRQSLSDGDDLAINTKALKNE
ncbi:MAG: hypothetical protein WD342_09730 [Verrucomicrobiales bacterium]